MAILTDADLKKNVQLQSEENCKQTAVLVAEHKTSNHGMFWEDDCLLG
jgi:hypothetical protein